MTFFIKKCANTRQRRPFMWKNFCYNKSAIYNSSIAAADANATKVKCKKKTIMSESQHNWVAKCAYTHTHTKKCRSFASTGVQMCRSLVRLWRWIHICIRTCTFMQPQTHIARLVRAFVAICHSYAIGARQRLS